MAINEEHSSAEEDQEKLPPLKQASDVHSLLLSVANKVLDAAEQASEQSATAKDYDTKFDMRILLRGTKSLDAVRLLINAGHWEYATSIARQLFELLVNIEHLNSLPDRSAAQDKYTGFGFVQFFLSESRRIEFDKQRGRPGATDWELAVTDFLSKSSQFQFPPRADGTVRWQKSWSGKTTRALAESSPDPLRAAQYELLFSAWSEQTHAAPGSFTTSLFVAFEDQIIADEFPVGENVTFEKSRPLAGAGLRSAQTIGIATLFLLQLWHQLPNIRHPDPKKSRMWTSIIRKLTESKGFPIG
ncbi:DUF5677 domain-containing protein [[Kitasatospora] papulosa]|uniref:DUF5677 domain-containing protein n=1 Tax=[Kitasatospora] papulosa TaxID=1464011 RepID=UPI00386BAED8|nr:DUF5677 domain-containing protein [[Kitasatospora] papulosa]